MLAEVDRTLAALYPTRTWGEADDLAGELTGAAARAGAPAAGLPAGDLEALADELAGTLAAATFVRPGGDDEPCDYIYVLCLGRTPCVVQARDHGVPAPAEWRAPGVRIDERYLRVVIGNRAPFAAVQQVAVELTGGPGGFLVRERPRAGVYDAPLLHRMQKLVAILPAYDLNHLDFGEIAHAPPGFHGGAWRELYGAEPSIANYLFYPQPTTMVATTFIEDSHARGAEAA